MDWFQEKFNMLLAHNVYFTLYNDSETAADAMVAACHKYLKDHPGVVFFAAGKVALDLARPVNDRMFQVALHVVFSGQEAHDAYQTAPDHLKFIDENKASWKQVRVFDSLVTG
ncbi:MAG: Dabb family protein [Planctomycetaceae bacterium]